MIFETDKYDFSEIHETIKKFYPFGISPVNNPEYQNYPGQQELERLLIENIHDDEKFKNGWIKKHNRIQEKTGYHVIGTTYGQKPSFSGYIELEKTNVDDLTRFKEIYFWISLLGSYYTIIATDRNEIRRNENIYYSTNFITVSPASEYESLFRSLSLAIEHEFMNYRFVPYFIYRQLIPGLFTRYSEKDKSTVFDALFAGEVDMNAPVTGDKGYGDDKWIKPGYIPG